MGAAEAAARWSLLAAHSSVECRALHTKLGSSPSSLTALRSLSTPALASSPPTWLRAPAKPPGPWDDEATGFFRSCLVVEVVRKVGPSRVTGLRRHRRQARRRWTRRGGA